MNKFALTTVAALPGSGGGASAWQSPEVVRKEARPATCNRLLKPAVPWAEGSEHAEDALLWGYAITDPVKRAEWKRNNYAMLYGNQRAARIADMKERLASPMSIMEYEAAWKEIASDAELAEYFSSPN